ncbi:MAG: hypothetical protein ACI8S7_001054, partial [Candidatus Krumholzibacteriia bacterium]
GLEEMMISSINEADINTLSTSELMYYGKASKASPNDNNLLIAPRFVIDITASR